VYAVIEDGGKQYKVSQGDHLLIEKRDLAEGQAELTFDKVLLLGEGEQARVGTPWLQGAKVVAKVVEAVRTKKVIGIKFARRKGYKKKFGHRQPLLRVQISSILG
jgi:large subunit ribosomal protein L21